MANSFDNDVQVEPLAAVVWQDRTTSPPTNLLQVGYTATDPNGVRSAPLGSLLSGPSGTWRNTDGVTAWELLTGTRTTSGGTTVISDALSPVDIAFHSFAVAGIPQAVTLPAGTFRVGVDGQNLQIEAGIRVLLDGPPNPTIQVRLVIGPTGFQAVIAAFSIPSTVGDVALRASILINANGTYRASVTAVATTAAAAKDAFAATVNGGGFDLLVDNDIGIDFAWSVGADAGDTAQLVDLSAQAFV
jgi:hypothetical protein